MLLLEYSLVLTLVVLVQVPFNVLPSSARLAASARFAAHGEPSCKRIRPRRRKPRPGVEATSSVSHSVPFLPSRVAIRGRLRWWSTALRRLAPCGRAQLPVRLAKSHRSSLRRRKCYNLRRAFRWSARSHTLPCTDRS